MFNSGLKLLGVLNMFNSVSGKVAQDTLTPAYASP